MTRNVSVFLSATIIAVVLTISAIRILQPGEKSVAAAPTWAPYTAMATVKTFDETDKEQGNTVWLVARRSDGSMVRVKKMQGSKEVGLKKITDLSIARQTGVDPLTKTTTTYPIPASHRVKLAQQPECPAVVSSQREVIAGVDTLKSTESSVYRSNQSLEKRIVIEEWRAPEMNCEVVKRVTTMPLGPDQNRSHREVYETVSVTFGEPSPTLFDVPSDYVETPPSQVLAEYERVTEFAEPCASCSKTGPMLDEVYYRSKTAK